MSEQLIGECLCVPLVVDVVGVLAAWDTTDCAWHGNYAAVSHQDVERPSVPKRAENAAQDNLVALSGISAGREGDR